MIDTSNNTNNEDGYGQDYILSPQSRLSILEKRYGVVEEHTITVSKLSSKVSVLLTLMSFAVFIVSGAAVYSFTGLDSFKDSYNDDRVEMHRIMNKTQNDNREVITYAIKALEEGVSKKMKEYEIGMDTRIDDIEDNMDDRMDSIQTQYNSLKDKIKEN